MYYYRMMDSGDWVGGLFMTLLGVLFLAAIVLIAVRLLKSGDRSLVQHATPLDLAKERYAKGELTKDEFNQIKKTLSE